MATGHQIFLYMVEQWDDSDSHAEELIALTGDYQVAQPAFEEAVTATGRQPTKELSAPRKGSVAITLPQAHRQLAPPRTEARVIGKIVMRDIRSDLQERANFLDEQIQDAYAHFEKGVQHLQNERDARVAELQGAHTMINKLIEFETGFMDNVVTLSNPQAPRLSLAKRIKASG